MVYQGKIIHILDPAQTEVDNAQAHNLDLRDWAGRRIKWVSLFPLILALPWTYLLSFSNW